MDIQNPGKQYNETDHLVYSCQYHVIFCPKFRRKVLTYPYDARLKEVFEDVAHTYGFKIIELEIMPDHVHMLIDCNPRFGIVECVKKLKGTSARIMRIEYPELKRRLTSLWTRSTFISTVGSVSLETVKRYIENQKRAADKKKVQA